MKLKKTFQERGFDAFVRHFRGIYGERFESLLKAMQMPASHVAYNPFQLPHPYYLDSASIIAARILPIKPNDRVLDMCSAPGGKALILAEQLGADGFLVANELSKARRERLKRVLSSHLPYAIQKQVAVTGHDASRFGIHQPHSYDAILLDAPCSSERHLLNKPELLKHWSARRSKFLGQRQYAMLSSALLAAKPGGYILYSTCSISPLENDEVVKRLLKKKKDEVTLQNPNSAAGDSTEVGRILLPDGPPQSGPMYFALLQKK